MTERLFVTGIGTGIGKTLVSAILVNALKADYWKPVQCGSLDDSDSMFISSFVSGFKPVVHPERFRLHAPLSPHAAAERENIQLHLSDFIAPKTENTLIIEGAGGALVPLSEKAFVIDIASTVNASIIIVSRHYLGSINHTLMTIESIKARALPIQGIIWSGDENSETESIITKISGVQVLGRVPECPEVTPSFISEQSIALAQTLRGTA